ncbi:hypothetical protein C8D87_10673 [Lentzea atacamensis]|uniref:Polyketide cyclase / dehydrase and lipid transport n=1 Tax=Lentzea atacamensis TaxID=531938 RepID=A0ABX9E3Q4_9PSEU|nr:hypothetical protein [Lentzea atacamensis]RAS63672.1 hypothetical protein C8D87_10673 [Lentzea atacamensis]
MDVDVVVQWVRTEWTKASRGGVSAGLRNSLPVAFALPHTKAAVHEVFQREWEDYEPVWSEESSSIDRMRLGLREEDGILAVQLQDVMLAAPRRWARPSPVRLQRGEWVRWQLNHRWVRPRDGGWNYEMTTLNLAYGGVADLKVFLGKPTRLVDERARLR